MGQVVLIGDAHIGARNGSPVVMEFQLKFFEEVVFPFMEKNGITDILQSGDIFDSRRYTNHTVLYHWYNRFFDVLEEKNYQLHMIIGNHDTAYKSTNEIASPNLFFSRYSNVHVYNEPSVYSNDALEILMVPWICDDNRVSIMEKLNNPPCKWTLGHYEIKDMEMHKGQVSPEGMETKAFSKFEKVLSGHYHTRSDNGNIHYVGTPYEMTWIDWNDQKGFHTIDTSTLEIKFHKNPYTLFNKLYYDDSSGDKNYSKNFDLSGIENTYVKLVVVNKTDRYQFDKFVERLSAIHLEDLKIVEDMSDYSSDGVEDDKIEIEDTKSLLDSYVDAVDTELDRTKLKHMMRRLYKESLEVLE